MENKLLKNATILTLNEKDEILTHADIRIEGDTIKEIGIGLERADGEEVIDCTDLLVTPGFVNGHLHSDENMFKGKYDNMPLELWMLYAYPVSPEYGPFSDRLLYLRTMVGAIEQIKSGITSCQDDVSGHPLTTLEGHDVICKAYIDLGMRANITTSELHKNYLDTIPYLREIVPEGLQKKFSNPRTTEEALACAESIIKKWNGVDNIKIALSPIAPQRCDDDYNVKVFELAEKYDLPYHTHICETRMQRETGFKFYGKTIIEHCADIGILAPRTTIAHGNWLDDHDIQIVADKGANIVHNIVSNLKLGSGIMPYRKMLDAGVHLCFGTDGSSSNDSQNIMEVMKTAALIHKVTAADFRTWPTSDEIVDIATKGGARSLMREEEIGSVEVGKKADLLLFNLNSNAFTPLNNIKNHLVYCENGSSIEHVLIAGKFVMKNHKITTVDEAAILRELRSLHEEFMESHSKVLQQSKEIFPYVEKAYWSCMKGEDPLWRLSASKEEYANVYKQ